jgi:peptidoglycan/xylan/chitin deacetylase (PgdA/CDA1 family)
MVGPWLLMYHSVTHYQRDPYNVTVSPDRFGAHLDWLRSRGLRGVGVSELFDARRDGHAKGLVGLTFDDGYRDFVEEVMPRLVHRRFSATVYVVAGLLGAHNEWDPDGERKALMAADEVRAVAQAGIEIGAHGRTHVPLAGANDLTEEVAESRRVLQDVIGGPVRGFCYPYGSHDRAAVAAVRASGYDHACAVGRPPVPGRYALPRTDIRDHDGMLRLEAKRACHWVAELAGSRRSRMPM